MKKLINCLLICTIITNCAANDNDYGLLADQKIFETETQRAKVIYRSNHHRANQRMVSRTQQTTELFSESIRTNLSHKPEIDVQQLIMVLSLCTAIMLVVIIIAFCTYWRYKQHYTKKRERNLIPQKIEIDTNEEEEETSLFADNQSHNSRIKTEEPDVSTNNHSFTRQNKQTSTRHCSIKPSNERISNSQHVKQMVSKRNRPIRRNQQKCLKRKRYDRIRIVSNSDIDTGHDSDYNQIDRNEYSYVKLTTPNSDQTSLRQLYGMNKRRKQKQSMLKLNFESIEN